MERGIRSEIGPDAPSGFAWRFDQTLQPITRMRVSLNHFVLKTPLGKMATFLLLCAVATSIYHASNSRPVAEARGKRSVVAATILAEGEEPAHGFGGKPTGEVFLGPVDDPDQRGTADLISALLEQTEPEAAYRAAVALIESGGLNGVEALFTAASMVTDPDLKQALLDALDLVSEEESVTLAASALVATEDPELIEATRKLLARAGQPETVDFLAELYGESASVSGQRLRILEAIQAIANPEALLALGKLTARFDDPELALAAAVALAKIGSAEAVERIREASDAAAASGHDALAGELARQFRNLSRQEQNRSHLEKIALEGDPRWSPAAREILERSTN